MRTIATFFLTLCIAICSYAQTPDCLPNCAEVVATKITKPFDCLTTKKDSTIRLYSDYGPYDIKLSQLIPGGFAGNYIPTNGDSPNFKDGTYILNGQMVRFFRVYYRAPTEAPLGVNCDLLVLDHTCKLVCSSCFPINGYRPQVFTAPCGVDKAVLINCNFTDPTKDIVWLRNFITNWTTLSQTNCPSQSKLEIKSATLEGQTVFIVNRSACGQSSPQYIYRCDGSILCSSSNSCAYLLNNLTNVKQIYSLTN